MRRLKQKPGPILPPEPFDYVEPKEVAKVITVSLGLIVIIGIILYNTFS